MEPGDCPAVERPLGRVSAAAEASHLLSTQHPGVAGKGPAAGGRWLVLGQPAALKRLADRPCSQSRAVRAEGAVTPLPRAQGRAGAVLPEPGWGLEALAGWVPATVTQVLRRGLRGVRASYVTPLGSRAGAFGTVPGVSSHTRGSLGVPHQVPGLHCESLTLRPHPGWAPSAKGQPTGQARSCPSAQALGLCLGSRSPGALRTRAGPVIVCVPQGLPCLRGTPERPPPCIVASLACAAALCLLGAGAVAWLSQGLLAQALGGAVRGRVPWALGLHLLRGGSSRWCCVRHPPLHVLHLGLLCGPQGADQTDSFSALSALGAASHVHPQPSCASKLAPAGPCQAPFLVLYVVTFDLTRKLRFECSSAAASVWMWPL